MNITLAQVGWFILATVLVLGACYLLGVIK